jgi:hypothetical protein
MCGNCGAVFPAEAVLSDAEVEQHKQERQWARDLADRFTNSGKPQSATTLPPLHDSEHPEAVDLRALEQALKRSSCASEFRHRNRPVWFYVGGCGVTLLVLGVMAWVMGRGFGYNRGTLIGFSLLAGMNVVSWLLLWRNAMPICPNCKQNIRLCPADFCHRCGKGLHHHRCTDCGVDNSWIGVFRRFGTGTRGRIIRCPGCGVELDTWIIRQIYKW